jgi:hypothetical protein
LEQHIAHVAMLVDGTPELVVRAVDAKKHRIKMPVVTSSCPMVA